jgi:hypothetical protein
LQEIMKKGVSGDRSHAFRRVLADYTAEAGAEAAC